MKGISSKEIQLPPRHQLSTPLGLALTAAIASADPAQAVQINFSYGTGITSDQMLGMEIAGEIWSSYLTDDATVNIHVETTDGLPEGIVGGALPGIETKLKYKKYRGHLNANQSSLEDRIATETPSSQGDELKTVANGYEIKDDNEYINLTRANAKAVGLYPKDNEELDGYILSKSIEFDIIFV